MTSADDIKRRLEAIEVEINDVEARLPAHGVKPPLMIQLFALEEERDTLLKQLAAGAKAP